MEDVRDDEGGNPPWSRSLSLGVINSCYFLSDHRPNYLPKKIK